LANSLIYIPDISGFTDFVNNTEINHAQHIISELLEIIIDANELGMKVSEIEGDAVLFYKYEEVPNISDLIEQTEKIFIAFHEHIKRYEIERVCQCGACASATTLTLKMIAHAGEIGFTRVKSSTKPFGPTVVMAHRLMKNDIDDHEYLLFTETFSDEQISSVENPSWAISINHIATYDGNTIQFNYISLSALHEKVPEPTAPDPPYRISNPITSEIFIDKPLYFVFEMVNNLNLRLLWRNDLKDLEYEKGKLNRVGTKHKCLFNRGFADFETVIDDFGEETLVYGERLLSVPFVDELSFYYLLTASGEGTKIAMEVHYKKKPIWGWVVVPLLRKKFGQNILKTLKELKRVRESTEDIDYAIL